MKSTNFGDNYYFWMKNTNLEVKHDFDHHTSSVSHRNTKFIQIPHFFLEFEFEVSYHNDVVSRTTTDEPKPSLVGQTEPTSLSFQGKSRLKGKQAALHSLCCLTMITERGTPKLNKK